MNGINAEAQTLLGSATVATSLQVKLYDGRSDVDYVLTGRLGRLDKVDYGNGIKVEVALSA